MNNECWYLKACSKSDSNECSESCIRYAEMRSLIDSSNIPVRKQNPSNLTLIPDDCDYDRFCALSDLKDNILEFVENGNNIYLCSAYTGNGKTTWSIKLLLKYFDAIWAGNGFRCRGIFVHVPTFLLKLKEFDKRDSKFEELKANILNADLVVWDDVAGSGMSAYDHSQLLSYIDQRMLDAKANIFTGNIVNVTELERAVGNRLASRIYNGSQIIEFKGKDKR